MKKFIIVLSFFVAVAFGVNYDNSYNDESEYFDNPQEERSIRNQILREAGCKAIYTLSNGRFYCAKLPR